MTCPESFSASVSGNGTAIKYTNSGGDWPLNATCTPVGTDGTKQCTASGFCSSSNGDLQAKAVAGVATKRPQMSSEEAIASRRKEEAERVTSLKDKRSEEREEHHRGGHHEDGSKDEMKDGNDKHKDEKVHKRSEETGEARHRGHHEKGSKDEKKGDKDKDSDPKRRSLGGDSENAEADTMIPSLEKRIVHAPGARR